MQEQGARSKICLLLQGAGQGTFPKKQESKAQTLGHLDTVLHEEAQVTIPF